MNTGTLALSRFGRNWEPLHAWVSEIDSTLPRAHRGVACRGAYCIAISCLETYFTFLASEVFADRIDRARAAGVLDDLGRSYKEFLSQKLKIKSPVDFSAPVAHVRFGVHSDFSRMIINRPIMIDMILELVSPEVNISELWSNIAQSSSLKNSEEVRISLGLMIERRNRITHYGDLREGLDQIPITSGQVMKVCSLIGFLVAAVDGSVMRVNAIA